MKVVAIASQKGGVGKSLLAINLAIAAELAGLSAIVIDLDPQASAAGWGDLREADSPAIVAAPAPRLDHALRAAEAGGADIAVLDTPPHAEGAALVAVKAADLIVIPCRPALLDLRAIGATAALAQIAGRPAFVVLNAVPPGAARLIDEARKAAAVHGLAVAPATVTQRAAFGHALTADLIMIPCRPALLDLRAIGATAALAQIAGKPAFVVLNAVPPGAARLIDEARKAAAVHGLAMAPATVTQRAAFGHALTAGQGVQEFEPTGKAAEEIERLYGWLAETIGLRGKRDGKRKRTG